MITRLTVENYQSIEKADVELKPLTVIVGNNRAGKSALLRALTSLITNKTGSGFITHGKPHCTVRAYTDDDVTVEWHKTRNSAEYNVTTSWVSEKLTKLAGQVPLPVSDALGIREVEIDANLSLWPQIHKQGQYAFLVDLSPGAAARAIAKLTRLDVVVKAQQLSKAAERHVADSLKVETAKRDSAVEELKEFADIDERERELEEILKKKLMLDTAISKLEAVEHADVDMQYALAYMTTPYLDTTDLKGTLNLIHVLEGINVPVVPASIDTGELSQHVETLEALARINDDLEHSIRQCSELWSMLDNLDEQSEMIQELLKEYNGTVCPVCGGIVEITSD